MGWKFARVYSISGMWEIALPVYPLFRFTTIGCRVIWRSCRSGRYDPAFVERSRPRTGCDRRHAVVYRRSLLPVGLSCLHMLSLSGYRRNMSLTHGSLLLRCGTRVDPTIATVVADAVHYSSVVNNRRVVNVVDIGDVHIVH